MAEADAKPVSLVMARTPAGNLFALFVRTGFERRGIVRRMMEAT